MLSNLEEETGIDMSRKNSSQLSETDSINSPRPIHGIEINDLQRNELLDSKTDDRGIHDTFLNQPANPYPINYLPNGNSTPDVNVYQQKKTIAQGMMDLALLSANANQIRYILQTAGSHPYYYISLSMIGLSLLLQVIVGIGLIWNSRYDVKVDAEMCKANRASNWTIIVIFIITILNVLISSFSVVELF